MKVTERFDQHNDVWLRAVLKEDTDVADLSNRMALSGHQLYEVYLIPESVESITPEFLKAASFNSVAELLQHYQSKLGDPTVHGYAVELRLVDGFGIGINSNTAHFHCSVIEAKVGPVISVVFGSYRAMEKMYEAGLRSRLGNVVADECSE